MSLDVVNYAATPSAGGKFVVFVLDQDPHSGLVLFSDFTRDFQHHDIVRRWEEAQGASAAASGYRIAGGGWWRLENATLVLYGRSAAYGRFDPGWVRPRLDAGSVFTETRIDVV